MTTCEADKQEFWGRPLRGCIFCGVNGVSMELPHLTECSHIPQSKSEIALPHLVEKHEHLAHLAIGVTSL